MPELSSRETTAILADSLLQTTLLGEVLENFEAAVFVADEARKYVAVNRAACTLLGYERSELLGLHVDDVAVDVADYGEVVAHRKQEGQVALRRKDGVLVPAEWLAGETTISGMTFYVGICRAVPAPA